MAPVLISKPEHSIEDGWHVASSSISVNGEPRQLKFKVSEGHLAKGSEPFLSAMLFPAMRIGQDLEISGTVSPKLFKSIETIQAIFNKWFPEFQKVDVQASPGLPDEVREASDVGVFFSGGVDSFYTLLKHLDEITKIIFVHGLDIKLENISHRSKVSKEIHRIAREFGKPLIEVETNGYEFARQCGYEGSFLASIGLALSPQFKKIYFASTFPYDDLMPDSSHPLLDPLWGTESLTFEHDGCEASRLERVATIAQSDIALRSLRVCSTNPEDDYNCGQCEKCLRTMLALLAVGALERCTTFKNEPDIEAVSRLKFRLPRRQLPYAEENLRALESSGNHPDLVEALRHSIESCRRKETAKFLYGNVNNEFLASDEGARFVGGKKNIILKSLWQMDREWLFREVFKEKLKELDQSFLGGILRKLYVRN
jgi:diphthamide synthase (EF-2-diphthine--ammonia ligase)